MARLKPIDWRQMASKAVLAPAFSPNKRGTGDGNRVLILGNSPALGMVDLKKIPLNVITIGLNRICAIYVPDYVLMVDRTIEDRFVPPEGTLRGKLITLQGSPFAHRTDSIAFKRMARHQRTMAEDMKWPRRTSDPWLISGNTANYAFQWALVSGAQEVAMIGVDYNGTLLRKDRKHTHFFGYNRAAAPAPINEGQVTFWKQAKAQGVTCLDLSPYDTTPFQEKCGWYKENWDEWCARDYARVTGDRPKAQAG